MESSFQEFYQQWKTEQNNQLTELVNISSKIPQPNDSLMSDLVKHVIDHYQKFYDMKSSFADQNLFPILSPQWNSPLEDAFTWIGGWRPSTAFHLLYSVSGLQFDANLNKLLCGVETNGDLGDLSSEQIKKIDGLQRSTIKEERAITEEHAKQQEKVADAEMVELSHVISDSIRGDQGDDVMMDEADRVDEAMKAKEDGLNMVLEKADDLRMRTLKGVIEILTPIQAVHFLIGAAELQLRLNDWGKEKEKEEKEKEEKQIDVQMVQQPIAAAEAS